MKSVYIESSVISYMTARPSRDVVTSARQAITIEWWETYKDSFEVFISELVLEEIGSGDLQAASNRLASVADIPVLVATDNAKILAKVLIAELPFRFQARKTHYISVLPLYKALIFFSHGISNISTMQTQEIK